MHTVRIRPLFRIFLLFSAVVFGVAVCRGPEAKLVKASDGNEFICLNGETPYRQSFNAAYAKVYITHDFYAISYTSDSYLVVSSFAVGISLPEDSGRWIQGFTFYASPNQWADNPSGVQYTGQTPNMKAALPEGSLATTQETTINGFSVGSGLEQGKEFGFGSEGGKLSAEVSGQTSIRFSYQHSISSSTDEPQVQYFYGEDDDLSCPGAKWFLNFKTREFVLFTQRFVLIYSLKKGGTNIGSNELGVSVHCGFRITTNQDKFWGIIFDEVSEQNDTGFAIRYYF